MKNKYNDNKNRIVPMQNVKNSKYKKPLTGTANSQKNSKNKVKKITT